MAPTFINTRLTMIRNAVEMPLSDGTVLFDTPEGPVMLYYIADDGIGMASLVRFSERGPAQHGDTDLGFLLEPRIVTYIFGIYAPNTSDSRHLDTARMQLMRQFRPANIPTSFRYNRANGNILQIDGYFTGGMQFSSTERDPGTWFQRFSVEFKMPDPVWYDPTDQAVELLNENWAGGTPVALPVAFPVGESSFFATQDIAYDGSWESYPDFRISGPLRDFTIQNETLGLTLSFIGEIEMNTYWDIHLTSGLKTITDSVGVSQMSALLDPNDFDTFRFGADPDAPSGVNTLSIVGEGSNGMTQVDITYKRRFIGI